MKGYLKSSIRNGTRRNNITLRNGTRRNNITLLAAAAAALLVAVGVSLFAGPASIQVREVLDWIIRGEQSGAYGILQHVRLPRSLAPPLCGMSLAVSGVLLQSALNNPLASSGVIGVNSGAGLFALLAGFFLPGVFAARNLAAFGGALLSSLLVFAISGRLGGSKNVIVMTGIAVGSLMSAGSDALVTLRPDSLSGKNAFFIGGFAHVSIQPVFYALPFIAVGLLGAALLAPHLDVMLLGDETAVSLGLPVRRCRFFALICASLLAAASVCIGGILGFVGLMAPHASRTLIGRRHRLLIPFSACLGGILVTGCDILARLLLRPYEIPVGILLSCLGAPFFLFLVAGKKGGRSYD